MSKKLDISSIRKRLQHCKFSSILHNLFINCHEIVIYGHLIPMFLATLSTLKQDFSDSIPDLICPRIHRSPAYNSLPVSRHLTIDMLRCEASRTMISTGFLRRRNLSSALQTSKCLVNLFHDTNIDKYLYSTTPYPIKSYRDLVFLNSYLANSLIE